jgi:polyphosphate glucokinase
MKKTEYNHILSVDIGGSHIKATILNKEGKLQVEYNRLPTPQPATPVKVVQTIKKLITDFPAFDCVSVGFPGYVKKGIIKTAPNLGTKSWQNINLQKLLEEALQKPVRIVNDADLQGLGVAKGKGFEIVTTLGTGFGTALLFEGHLLPHMELAHYPLSKKKDYDDYIGEKALKSLGKAKWNTRMKRVIKILQTVFNYDHLYLGGGNASKINFKLDKNVTVITNRDGIKGGVRLWQMDENNFKPLRQRKK